MFTTMVLTLAVASASPAQGSQDANRAAIGQIRDALDERYAHADRLAIDWDAELDATTPDLLSASSPAAFATVLGGVLSKAEDVHIAIDSGQGRRQVYNPEVKPNFSMDAVRERVADLDQRSRNVWAGTLEGDVGYLLITSWSGDIEPAVGAIEAMHDKPAIIIDVRPNGGGDDSLAELVARCFFEREHVVELVELVDPSSPTGFSRRHERALAPEKNAEPYRGKVLTLIGPVCCSSNETFIHMMRHGAGSTLVGETTFGASANARPHELANGVTLYLPSWRVYAPDGSALEGVGIKPDIAVKWDDSDNGHDPVLDRAIEIARP